MVPATRSPVRVCGERPRRSGPLAEARQFGFLPGLLRLPAGGGSWRFETFPPGPATTAPGRHPGRDFGVWAPTMRPQGRRATGGLRPAALAGIEEDRMWQVGILVAVAALLAVELLWIAMA
jgi:hypothetical protein